MVRFAEEEDLDRVNELRRQVSAGEYRADARETASRMLLLSGEGE